MTAPVSRERIAEIRDRHLYDVDLGRWDDDETDLLATAEAYHDEHDRAERLAGMVEWLAEVVVDARDACQRAESIQPQGSPDWVASGIAMRTTALREVRQVLDRERNAHPSRYDEVKAERDAARAAHAALIADLEALCDRYEFADDRHEPPSGQQVAAKVANLLDRHKEAGT